MKTRDKWSEPRHAPRPSAGSEKPRPSSPSLASAPAAESRSGGFRAVGVAVAKLAAPIVAKSSSRYLGRLKAAWPAVAGGDWAASAWPQRLGRDGVLKLWVMPAAALELQHRAPLLIERINMFLGNPVVRRLILKQATPPQAAIRAAPAIRPFTAEEAASLDCSLLTIADPELRSALVKLGRAVLARTPTAASVASDHETD